MRRKYDQGGEKEGEKVKRKVRKGREGEEKGHLGEKMKGS